MYSKLIPLLFASLLISSCCWFMQDDCAGPAETPFAIKVAFQPSDSLLQVDEPLNITIKSTDFLDRFTEERFQYSNFNIEIIWFNGDFSSSANSKVNLLSSSESQFSLTDYQGYNGTLPDDIELEIAFPIPGYYMILFDGGAFKDGGESQGRRNRCKVCSASSYVNFLFDNDTTNDSYYPLYESSSDGVNTLYALKSQGAFFIKVE